MEYETWKMFYRWDAYYKNPKEVAAPGNSGTATRKRFKGA